LTSKWLSLHVDPYREQVIEWLEVRHFFECANELQSRLGGLRGEIVDLSTECERGKWEDERARDEAIQIVEDSAKQLAERILEMQYRCRKAKRGRREYPGEEQRRRDAASDAERKAAQALKPTKTATPKSLREFLKEYLADKVADSRLKSLKKAILHAVNTKKIAIPLPVAKVGAGQTPRYKPEDLRARWAGYQEVLTFLPGLRPK
jgi:hypothetical protein